jgi:predicted enzyme related to lactoylglutathione lyase
MPASPRRGAVIAFHAGERRWTMANPFVHVELHTNDVDAAKKFYRSLFDWNLEEMPGDMPYTMIKVGEGTGGGMMKSPMPGAPPSWLAYIQVSDVAATTKKAKELGAKVIQDRTEIPDMGAFSVLTDPQGAAFALWEMKRKT